MQRRDPDMWTTVEEVLEEIHSRNWKVECLAWHPGVYHDDEEDVDDDPFNKDVYLFQINLR